MSRTQHKRPLDVDALNRTLGDVDIDEIEALFDQMESQGLELVEGTVADKDDLPPEAYVSIEELRELEASPLNDTAERWRTLLASAETLTSDQVAALASAIRGGSAEARATLIQANLRLVAKVARRFNRADVPNHDLLQEGIIGLVRAVERFDPSKGSFVAYAEKWIRQAMSRAVSLHSRGLRLPASSARLLRAAARAKGELQQELGREASVEEVAQRIAVPPHELRDLFAIATSMRSLEAPVGGEEGSSLGDFIEGDTDTEEDWELRSELRLRVEELLSTLTEEQRKVVSLRYGIDDGEPKSVDQVAQQLGISQVQVAEIEHEAQARLRARGFDEPYE